MSTATNTCRSDALDAAAKGANCLLKIAAVDADLLVLGQTLTMGALVTFDVENSRLNLGQSSHRLEDGGFTAHVDELGGVSATDLRAALVRVEVHHGDEGAKLWVSLMPAEQYIDEWAVVEPIHFTVDDDRLVIDVDQSTDLYEDEEVHAPRVAAFLAPLLTRAGGDLVSVEMNDLYAGPWHWNIRIRPTMRGRDLATLFRLGQDVSALLAGPSWLARS